MSTDLDLRTCPDCGKRHLPIATRCPRCGHAYRRESLETEQYERRLRFHPAVAVTGAVVIAVGVGVWFLMGFEPAAPAAPAIAPTTTRVQVSDPAEATPAEAAIDTTAAATPDATSAPPAAPAPTPPATIPRWVSEWANVREAPSLDAPVVTVIRPGTRVDVGRRASGFWEVWRDGRSVGYVAASLLLRRAPSDSAR